MWDYITNWTNFFKPHPNLRVLGPNLRFFAGHKVRGVFETTGSNTQFSEFGRLRQAGLEVYQDGSPYVYVTFNDPKEYKPDRPNMNPFGQNVTSIEDLMKNMPKVITNIGFMGPGLTDSPTIKFSMPEYQDMGIKVGDKVYIEIQKTDSSGGI